jgi:hypothetical protein
MKFVQVPLQQSKSELQGPSPLIMQQILFWQVVVLPLGQHG